LTIYQEWDVLISAVGGFHIAGKMLKAKNGWDYCNRRNGNGIDKYKFSALPGGTCLIPPPSEFYQYSEIRFNGIIGYWWTANCWGKSAYRWRIGSCSNQVSGDYDDMNCGFSVRCVKNIR
jgi:uncharacterized protein (TIGR02145 family)